MVMVLALLGGGLVLVAIIGFFKRPEHASVSYKGVEVKGPVAMAVIGCGLIAAAVAKSNAANASDESSPIATDHWQTSPPAGPTPTLANHITRPRPIRQTIPVPFYGTLEIGGSCQGQHLLTDTWNCDASRTQRVHCQNDMVTVEPCLAGCIQHQNGLNDECR